MMDFYDGVLGCVKKDFNFCSIILSGKFYIKTYGKNGIDSMSQCISVNNDILLEISLQKTSLTVLFIFV